MNISYSFDDNTLKSLMFYTHTNNESEALSKAVESYLQWQKQKSKRDLLALRGKVDIENNWEILRSLELAK
jgi:hypothetical protein